MPIASTDIKFYKSFDGDSEGGAITTLLEIDDATLENLFDNVSATEAENGDTEYRKFFVKNEHASTTWDNVVAWLSSLTPSPDSNISIGVGSDVDNDGSSDLEAMDDDNVIKIHSDGADTRSVYLVGENENGIRTTETMTLNGQNLVTSSNTYSRLYLVYVTSQDGSRTVYIRQGDDVNAIGSIGPNKFSAINYLNPSSKDLGFKLGSIAPAATKALWVRRVINIGAEAYDADQATVRLEGETA